MNGSAGEARSPLIVLIDDARSFKDDRPCEVARTSADAIAMLRRHPDRRIDELWLDHDLAGRRSSAYADTVMPVVDEIVQSAAAGSPYEIGVVYVHTSNPTGAVTIRRALQAAGYHVRRSHAPIWRHEWGSHGNR